MLINITSRIYVTSNKYKLLQVKSKFYRVAQKNDATGLTQCLNDGLFCRAHLLTLY